MHRTAPCRVVPAKRSARPVLPPWRRTADGVGVGSAEGLGLSPARTSGFEGLPDGCCGPAAERPGPARWRGRARVRGARRGGGAPGGTCAGRRRPDRSCGPTCRRACGPPPGDTGGVWAPTAAACAASCALLAGPGLVLPGDMDRGAVRRRPAGDLRRAVQWDRTAACAGARPRGSGCSDRPVPRGAARRPLRPRGRQPSALRARPLLPWGPSSAPHLCLSPRLPFLRGRPAPHPGSPAARSPNPLPYLGPPYTIASRSPWQRGRWRLRLALPLPQLNPSLKLNQGDNIAGREAGRGAPPTAPGRGGGDGVAQPAL